VKRSIIAVVAVCILFVTAGFSLNNAIVPKEQILSGGVPKDGIPALLEPHLVAAAEAEFLTPEDEVIGVRFGSEAKAYPIKILNWHEVVNDTLAGEPFVVTF
jgi:hypothetical protein